MDSEAVVNRFQQERQALALMDHDGIAKVFDCGTNEQGQPYFVMEYVDGVAIDEFCDRFELSLPERLRLIQQVCAAVEHAHQKGVVHRDLKPSNVLVTGDASRAQIKVIDFGLAKAMGEQLVEATLFTQAGQVVGTPEYMAPEQADPANADIDTRADVYSLGVILYGLLVGELPFAAQELRRGGMLEIQRILRTVDPPRPSTRLSTVAATASKLAAMRSTSPAALRAALRNDLDWVVLKSLDKDRDRRYSTAEALGEDLQRFLDHEPLQAGPPSATYRLRKFARRYRVQVLTAAAVFVTALVGAIVATGYAVSASSLAADKTALADALDTQVQEYELLASVSEYDEVVATERALVPAWPRQIEAMEQWLERDYGALHRRLPAIDAAIERIETLALPWSDEEKQRDLEAFDRREEWQRVVGIAAALARADRIRTGEEQLVVPELDAKWSSMTASELVVAAIRRVQPHRDAAGKGSYRSIWGEEALGLALARRAVELGGASPNSAHMQVLAEALLENGQDDQALKIVDQQLKHAARSPARQVWDNEMRRQIADPAAIREQVAASLAELQVEATRRRSYSFPSEHAAAGVLYRRLVELRSKMDDLAVLQRARVQQRLEWARRIEQLSQRHPNAQHEWDDVRRAIATNDNYAGRSIALRAEDCMGLVPLGENPVTGLHEFYHLRSAWDGEVDPATLPIPAIQPDGSIPSGEFHGIVFVLLPGGRHTLGRSRDDGPIKLNFALLGAVSSMREVDLEPFFVGRFELTKWQWRCLWTGVESGREPCAVKIGERNPGKTPIITAAHPVEDVDWTTSMQLLVEHGLTLPTDDQWEYACRAGTTTKWICEREELVRYANFSDASIKRQASNWMAEKWDDGFPIHAPVGSFLPNAFGLYDLHGNVAEWCRDRPRASGWGGNERVSRGGCFGTPARNGASEVRVRLETSYRSYTHGLRAMRRLCP